MSKPNPTARPVRCAFCKRRDALIYAMLRGFEALDCDHWAKVDVRVWARDFRRRAAKLGITAKETKPRP